jgi:hypothetical protein
MIDKNPAKGRIILLETSMTDGFVGRSGLITRISKTRIYYTPLTNGRGQQILNEKEEKHTYNFTYVCDTQEEAERLQEHSWSCVVAVLNLRESNKKAFEAMIV